MLARDYHHGKVRWMPGRIKEVLGPLSYLVSLSDGCVVIHIILITCILLLVAHAHKLVGVVSLAVSCTLIIFPLK